MEQKKTLWIIAAVGVFLLVVLGGACIVYTPSKKNLSKPVTVSSKTNDRTPAKDGWTTNNIPGQPENHRPERPDFNTPPNKVNEMFVVSENTTVYDINKKNTSSEPAQVTSTATTIDLNALKREITAEVAANQPQSQNINITVTMPEKETAPVIITPDYGKSQQTETTAPATKTVEKKETTVATTKTTTPAKTTTTKPAATAKTTTTTKPAATTAAPAPKTVTRYWVQVAAYTNKKTAENARSVLTDNKISSDIFTYTDAKNRLFYRVRVGPYTTKSEAEYWQAKIIKIEDFKNSQSYVTSTTD